ncbi:MAG: tRNA (adenosine(37)-N6)-dimethylallyltransferase MiaA [Bacteroidales bacterium]
MIIVTGPTALGKTRLAARLAAFYGGEIISADSRQVFKNMDIGTGKDLNDYVVDGDKVPFYLVDIRFPGDTFSVYDFVEEYNRQRPEIIRRGKHVIVCGGTGLYIEAIIAGYHLPYVPVDQELREKLQSMSDEQLIRMLADLRPLHNTTDITDRDRLVRALEIELWKKKHPGDAPTIPPYLILGLTAERQELRRRITERLHHRLKNGLIEEVQTLLERGVPHEKLEFYGLEYRYVYRYLKGQLSLQEMTDQLNTAIHQFAKRQQTWFRRMERKGFHIHWLNAEIGPDELFTQARRTLDEHRNQWDELAQ